MKKLILIFAMLGCLVSCVNQTYSPHQYTKVKVQDVYVDTTSIRAITLMQGNLGFAGSNNTFGIYNTQANKTVSKQIKYDTLDLEFRAVASTDTDFFMLSVGSPALLYKTGDQGAMEVVYKEEGEGVFYDAMRFWNAQEGIAIGDPTAGCLSVIITRDGGQSWSKLNCSVFPSQSEGEYAFAASNTNIAISGEHTWIATGGSKAHVFYSPDKGVSWEVFDTPIIQGEQTQGIYSIAFYDEKTGFIIGGDYTKPKSNKANKAITNDGGRSWQLVADGQEPGYRSAVQYVPGSQAKELVAIGFEGISFSNDGGQHWKQLSDESFYTLKFVSDSTAFAAGKGRISKLTFQ